jgi:F0F1-type ATP synthase membrane subunit b/b'
MEKFKQFLHDKGVWVAGISAGVIVLLLIIFGAALSNKSDEVKKLETRLASTQTERDEAEGKIDRAEAKVTRIEGLRGKIVGEAENKATSLIGSAKSEAEEAEENLSSLKSEVESTQGELESIEGSLGGAEEEKALSTIPGDGTFKAEADYLPGTYRASGGPGCYWATLNSANPEDIASNENASGPTIASIHTPYFHTQGCGKWERIGE